jgi:hypothetical protein
MRGNHKAQAARRRILIANTRAVNMEIVVEKMGQE